MSISTLQIVSINGSVVSEGEAIRCFYNGKFRNGVVDKLFPERKQLLLKSGEEYRRFNFAGITQLKVGA